MLRESFSSVAAGFAVGEAKGTPSTLHCHDDTIMQYADGTKHWCRNGQLHREDGPAVERADGTKCWYRNGQFHREDGPAVEWADGGKSWYRNGERHREDGPALERPDGAKFWYLDGKELTPAEMSECLADHERVRLARKKAGMKAVIEGGTSKPITVPPLIGRRS